MNQCDGCKAGKPVDENGNHRMGKEGGYADLMKCEAGKYRKSMTYGVMPTREAFDAAFEAACPNGRFHFGNDKRVGTDDFTANELWDKLNEAHSDWQAGRPPLSAREQSGDWVCLVLNSLGFEWI